MQRKILSLVLIFSFTVNPFVKKYALHKIDTDTGYALSQLLNFSVIFLSCSQKFKISRLEQVKIKNVFFLILSSLLTLSGSLSLTENLKDNENIATYMSTINSLNILSSFLVESCIKYKWIGFKKCIGIGFVCCGIKLLN